MEPMSPEPQGFTLPPPFAPFGGGFGPTGPSNRPMGGTMGEAPAYAPQPRPQRAGLALAAMICGIVGVFTFWLFGIVPILATVFGFISASAIKKSNGMRTGLGMARTGWILGVLGILGFGVFIWAAVTDRIGDKNDAVPVFDLEVGDCLAEAPGLGTVSDVRVIDCVTPHAAEVYFTGQLDPDRSRPFPGPTNVSSEARESCLAAFQPFVGRSFDESVLDVQFVQSSEIGWKLTRGGYVCFVFDPAGDVVGTMRGDDR
ncbi:MAG: DUF4190 domain-containing protein [Ilumatobacteraceae bacterium]